VRARNPKAQLMIGPWHHDLLTIEEARIGQVPTADAEIRRFYERMESFFDHHLKPGAAVADTLLPALRLFTMGSNAWRDEFEWPLARTTYVPFYLHSNGKAALDPEGGSLSRFPPTFTETPDEYDYDPRDPVAWSADISVWDFLNGMGDRRAIQERPDVLTYSTEPLRDAVEVTGPVRMTLYASSSAPDTDFVVTLVDVHPDGHTQYLLNGIVRARFRNGLERPELLEPGRVYEYKFELNPTSNLFKAGHRIRIEVTSSDFNRYPRNQNTAEAIGVGSATQIAHQVIHHDVAHPSCITLPVIPAKA
jgi:putative CocE/NonD family hydrolase